MAQSTIWLNVCDGPTLEEVQETLFKQEPRAQHPEPLRFKIDGVETWVMLAGVRRSACAGQTEWFRITGFIANPYGSAGWSHHYAEITFTYNFDRQEGQLMRDSAKPC